MQPLPPSQRKVLGNAEVIAGIERLLDRARSGSVRAAAVLCCEYHGADVSFYGDETARMNISFAADLLKASIMQAVLVKQDHKQAAPANVVTYDVNNDPVCYDFVLWLATQEMTRVRVGAPPLQVQFIAHAQAMQDHSQRPEVQRFVEHVMRPSLSLFNAVELRAPDAVGRRAQFNGLRDLGRGHAAGHPIPQLCPSDAATARVAAFTRGRAPVTLTLRETAYGTHRNSDLAEWHKLACWLEERHEDVVIVRDTARAYEPFGSFRIYPKASRDLHTRAALYASAKANLFVQNGPWALSLFLPNPWLLFAEVREDSPEHFNTPEAWRLFMGVDDADQIPWANAQQKLVYKRDTFENMRQAYEELGL